MKIDLSFSDGCLNNDIQSNECVCEGRSVEICVHHSRKFSNESIQTFSLRRLFFRLLFALPCRAFFQRLACRHVQVFFVGQFFMNFISFNENRSVKFSSDKYFKRIVLFFDITRWNWKLFRIKFHLLEFFACASVMLLGEKKWSQNENADLLLTRFSVEFISFGHLLIQFYCWMRIKVDDFQLRCWCFFVAVFSKQWYSWITSHQFSWWCEKMAKMILRLPSRRLSFFLVYVSFVHRYVSSTYAFCEVDSLNIQRYNDIHVYVQKHSRTPITKKITVETIQLHYYVRSSGNWTIDDDDDILLVKWNMMSTVLNGWKM